MIYRLKADITIPNQRRVARDLLGETIHRTIIFDVTFRRKGGIQCTEHASPKATQHALQLPEHPPRPVWST